MGFLKTLIKRELGEKFDAFATIYEFMQGKVVIQI